MTHKKHAETMDDLLPLSEALKISGLEFLSRIVRGDLPQPPIGKVLNYGLHEVSNGRAVFRGTPLFDHCNPIGTVHGGWYGALLDSAMACAFQATLPAGKTYTTLEYKVNVTRNLPIGTEIEAIGVVQHGGRSTGVVSAEIRGIEDGKLYATGSTTCMVLTPGA